MRKSGARGTVFVPYRTIEGTACNGEDYDATEGEIMFENEETELVPGHCFSILIYFF